MEEQDLKQIWKRSSKIEHITINMNQLLKDFKTGMEAREHIVRKRDRREIIAAILGMLGFIYSFYVLPNFISRIGSVLGFLSLIYIIFKLRNNRKSKFAKELFLPIQEQLIYQKQFMTHQVKLLKTVMYWLSLPLFVANALIVWGISKSENSLTILEHLSTKWEFKLIMTLVLAGFFAYIGWRNKKAAKVNWGPLLKQINTIIDNLKREES